MGNIYFFSGPCGCGKTALANAFAKYLADKNKGKQVYLIHGDDFHRGFVESDKIDIAEERMPWEDILKFNWECIISAAQKALDKGLDVVIDYVIEEELPLIRQLAWEYHADVYYVVLTASESCIRQRITKRGDTELIERALFLKSKLDNLPVNHGHLFDNTELSVEDEIKCLAIENFKL